ncbi:PREDICTED: uncharacterized protein LOC105363538 [Ceratosolen solmsi marchali]|uniref:Uncharacterized protein LOC105363538 n=1 Tax=Ceratosolen solmsi marchali TaxID=326594 RepID=A0AAJ6YK65_9HYME|nr:PREDICTED: uncharacterized protein LOC105363538 [Ceratosolen solmsi marchali]
MIKSSISSSALVTIIVCLLLNSEVDDVLGRKCVCTSKVCKESGTKTCRTRYSCYTELIYSGGVRALGTTIKTTRGCTDGPTPLLCETKSWRSNEDESSSSFELLGRAAWPKLTCCDSDDYCNAADEDFEPTARPDDRTLEIWDNASDAKPGRTSGRPYLLGGQASGNTIANGQGIQLHVAALVLAVAALISVFAACYVVTRFLNTSGVGSGLPRIIGPYGDRLDF